MESFVAFDFETANEQRRSACAVGLVRFNANGQVEGGSASVSFGC